MRNHELQEGKKHHQAAYFAKAHPRPSMICKTEPQFESHYANKRFNVDGAAVLHQVGLLFRSTAAPLTAIDRSEKSEVSLSGQHLATRGSQEKIGFRREGGPKVSRNSVHTLICRCSSSNLLFVDFYLVPKLDNQCSSRFLVSEKDPWLKTGKRLRDLSRLAKTSAIS